MGSPDFLAASLIVVVSLLLPFQAAAIPVPLAQEEEEEGRRRRIIFSFPRSSPHHTLLPPQPTEKKSEGERSYKRTTDVDGDAPARDSQAPFAPAAETDGGRGEDGRIPVLFR